MMALTPSVQAQKPHSDLHNEIGVGTGPFSVFGGFIIGTADFFGALGNSLSHRAYSSNYYGLYDVHYYYQINHWCQVGVKFTVEGSRTTIYTDTLRTAVSSIRGCASMRARIWAWGTCSPTHRIMPKTTLTARAAIFSPRSTSPPSA